MNQSDRPDYERPQWVKLADELMESIGLETLRILENFDIGDLTLSNIPLMSFQHFLECHQTASDANRQGMHAVAVCLIRQSLEALSLAEVGISRPESEDKVLSLWFDDKKNVGYIRSVLEKESWPRYGTGLWDEPWSEFYGNLAKSVHPYAHFSSPLLGWRFAEHPNSSEERRLVSFGYSKYDPLKASRITLLWAVVWYALARIISSQPDSPWGIVHRDQMIAWGKYLSSSTLLFREGQWDKQLMPHMFFNDGASWQTDE